MATSGICLICGIRAYALESFVIRDTFYHKHCFKCKTCGMKLTLKTYKLAFEGATIYCAKCVPTEIPTTTMDRVDLVNARERPKVGVVNEQIRGELAGVKPHEGIDSLAIANRINAPKQNVINEQLRYKDGSGKSHDANESSANSSSSSSNTNNYDNNNNSNSSSSSSNNNNNNNNNRNNNGSNGTDDSSNDGAGNDSNFSRRNTVRDTAKSLLNNSSTPATGTLSAGSGVSTSADGYRPARFRKTIIGNPSLSNDHDGGNSSSTSMPSTPTTPNQPTTPDPALMALLATLTANNQATPGGSSPVALPQLAALATLQQQMQQATGAAPGAPMSPEMLAAMMALLKAGPPPASGVSPNSSIPGSPTATSSSGSSVAARLALQNPNGSVRGKPHGRQLSEGSAAPSPLSRDRTQSVMVDPRRPNAGGINPRDADKKPPGMDRMRASIYVERMIDRAPIPGPPLPPNHPPPKSLPAELIIDRPSLLDIIRAEEEKPEDPSAASTGYESGAKERVYEDIEAIRAAILAEKEAESSSQNASGENTEVPSATASEGDK